MEFPEIKIESTVKYWVSTEVHHFYNNSEAVLTSYISRGYNLYSYSA